MQMKLKENSERQIKWLKQIWRESENPNQLRSEEDEEA